ncbi:GNAT family N-acetyltransferase [Nonomuraea soli]|uniref:Ribosomal protein S18 acetylase RimI-like enzyme n=1 Tax=Nonomuraea soli TaxID=1032476 RepID=A0A7W0HRI7_9ACTN|nr:GNAT family N-acetyltransferase [Nonomuraea soli]MBA2892691.1 ribosomal protein S18 acetylase RimI-like enzyme [Nonomuraea soli]
MTAHLRPYHPSDLAGIYRVCHEVDGAGRAEAPRFHDPDLPGHLYAGPYAVHEPGLCFVVADRRGVAGYVVGTASTPAFLDWARQHWWPVLRARHPRRTDPGDGTLDHRYVDAIHDYPDVREPWLTSHPAQAHIKLAARLQGQGWGHRLMSALTTSLRERQAPGLHLGVAEANGRALAFYAALGFTEARRHPWGRTLVLDL